jgi:hypothetical protein
MAQFNGPNPVTSGLRYLIDNNNQRSYTGPPLQNLAQVIVPVSTSGPSIEYVTGSTSVMIPNLGQTNSAFVNGYNSNPSSYCCMQQFFFNINNANVPCSGSTTYTYAIVYKNTSGYTHPNYMYRYEFTSGGSYVTEAGVFDAAKQISLGDGWFWAWNTFTTQATTAQIVFRSFYYQYNVSDIFYMARVMVVPGDFTQLNPRFWPALGTTKTSTQVFNDPLGTNITTTSNLTYASNGTFSFNGSTNSLIIPTINLGNGNLPWTVSAWVNTTTNASSLGSGSVLSNQSGGPVYSMLGVNSGKIVYWTYQNNAWAQKLGVGTTVNDGIWHQLTWVNNPNNTMAMYVDGVLDSNVADSTSGNNNPVDMIGGSWNARFAGSIYVIQIYNTALTASQVSQNFNAYRGRYGV